ncbi:MAG: asparagine synthase [Cyanobacteria bacterium QH_1_48_107]|nr:MAG: asparagine synthase [Cyanobacteria bacterium QH_1_48_107]
MMVRLNSVNQKILNCANLLKTRLDNPNVYRKIEKVKSRSLTYLDKSALIDLARVVLETESRDVTGDIIEAGCALGGSSIILAACKHENRKLLVYDAFGMIPPPSDKDGQDVKQRYEQIANGEAVGIDGNTYYGYLDDLRKIVSNNFCEFGFGLKENNISLIEGYYEDTLHINSPISVAHIDCDWYNSVYTCLEQIVPNLSKEGIIVVDDYFAWSGCKRAVDRYFADKTENFAFINKQKKHIKRVS